MFKLFPGPPGHLEQLIMHFGSGKDACFIVAMAVPVLEFTLLVEVDFPYIVCYFLSGNFSHYIGSDSRGLLFIQNGISN